MSLYGFDLHTSRARGVIASLRTPVTISDLNYYELEQAINFSVWRKLLPITDGRKITAGLSKDSASGAIQTVACNFANVLVTARRLSATHTQTEGHRSMDILQVAAALELDAEFFLSFDTNQRKLARAEGLKLNP
jgi:hypothetical protein